MGTLATFIDKHSSILKLIEAAALNDLLKLLTALYPNDPIILEIAAKVIDEIEKLQGITPGSSS